MSTTQPTTIQMRPGVDYEPAPRRCLCGGAPQVQFHHEGVTGSCSGGCGRVVTVLVPPPPYPRPSTTALRRHCGRALGLLMRAWNRDVAVPGVALGGVVVVPERTAAGAAAEVN